MILDAAVPVSEDRAISLGALTARIAGRLATPELRDVWTVAEASDMRTSGGHCYLELIEKNEATGAVTARIRAIIWASQFNGLQMKFAAVTGQRMSTGMKLLVRGTVNFHSAYGMSLVITDVDPSFTVGDVERRRREILQRLTREGIAEMNKRLPWPVPALRIAVISAPGAAGYGDFMHQLYANPQRLRFRVRLFEAVMQGEHTTASVINALERIASDDDEWDCVVIIRGGGATSDLISFDSYELASNVAQFPLPVIVGIGHERDVTVLDYVAAMRVKTPTAAAEWLVGQAQTLLDGLRRTAADILQTVTDRIGGCRTQLAYIEGQLPHAPKAAIERANAMIGTRAMQLSGAATARTAPERARLTAKGENIATAACAAMERSRQRLDSTGALLDALSPMATLRRGYSITRIDGHAVKSVGQMPDGTVIETIVADGRVVSTVGADNNHNQ